MASNAQKSFDVATGTTETFKFNGHPSYDAFRVDVDGGSGSADIAYYVSTNDEFDNVDTASATQVDSASGITSGGSDGSEVSARTVIVEITETTNTGSQNVSGVIYGHGSSDPAQNGAAFANR